VEGTPLVDGAGDEAPREATAGTPATALAADPPGGADDSAEP